MRKLLFTVAIVLPVVMMAGGAELSSGETDYIPRLVNFIIFVSLLYYFIAEPVKNYFKGRTAQIASKLEEAQERLKATKRAKEEALAEYEAAQQTAEEIIEAAKRECKLLAKRLDEQLQKEIENMEKIQFEKMEVEKRQLVRRTVSEVLDELFKSGAIDIDEKKFVNLIVKKVA